MRSFLPLLPTIYLFCCLHLANAQSNDRVIKIGVITDLSGIGSYIGMQVQAAANLVEKELLDNGHKIKFFIEDHKTNTQLAVTAAQKLVFMDGVDAVFVSFSQQSSAVSPLLKQNKILFVYSAAAHSILKSNPYAFKTYSDYNTGCRETARYLKRSGHTILGVMQPQADFGIECTEGASQVYEAKDLIVQEYVVGQNMYSEVLRAKQKGVKAFLNFSFEGDVINTIKAAHQLNYNVKVITADDAYTTQMLDQYGSFLEGSITFAFTTVKETLKNRLDNAAGLKKLPIHYHGATAYAAFLNLHAAISKCQAKDIDCQVSHLNDSPPVEESGFLRWNHRAAQFKPSLRIVKNKKIETLPEE